MGKRSIIEYVKEEEAEKELREIFSQVEESAAYCMSQGESFKVDLTTYFCPSKLWLFQCTFTDNKNLGGE